TRHPAGLATSGTKEAAPVATMKGMPSKTRPPTSTRPGAANLAGADRISTLAASSDARVSDAALVTTEPAQRCTPCQSTRGGTGTRRPGGRQLALAVQGDGAGAGVQLHLLSQRKPAPARHAHPGREAWSQDGSHLAWRPAVPELDVEARRLVGGDRIERPPDRGEPNGPGLGA